MQQLILKRELEKSKIDVLIALLKSWGVEAELTEKSINTSKQESKISFAAGIWKYSPIESNQLRKDAWGRKL